VIAVVLGVWFKDTPADAPSSLWPYFAAGYGALATVVPWLVGIVGQLGGDEYAGIDRDEFGVRSSLWLFVFFALPLGVSAHWLGDSPYYIISVGCWVLASLWMLHLLISVGAHVRGKGDA